MSVPYNTLRVDMSYFFNLCFTRSKRKQETPSGYVTCHNGLLFNLLTNKGAVLWGFDLFVNSSQNHATIPLLSYQLCTK